MKKNLNFHIGIAMSLLLILSEVKGQIIPKFGSIQINYPLNNSVFQQNSNGQSGVSIAGQILQGTYYTDAYKYL
jgi:hypothetical protein